MVKNPLANAGDVSLIAELGRFPGEGNDKLLQYSYFGQRSRAGYSHGVVKSCT